MALNALLLSRDPALLAMMRRSLDELCIQAEINATPKAALELISRRKFEAIIIDCDDADGAQDMVRSVRQIPTNKCSIVFAVIHRKTTVRKAFEMGANFVLEKPVSPDRALRCLRASHALMARERRRSFRHGIDVSVMLQIGQGPEVRARGVDLSEGGVAVWLDSQRLQANSVVRFRFLLPDSDVWLEGKANVAWTNEQGRAGLQFLALRPELRVELAQWLTGRPEVSAASFAAAV